MTSDLPIALARALMPMAPPSSIVHSIVSDDRAVQADLAILRRIQSGAAERARFDRAEREQVAHQHQIGRTL